MPARPDEFKAALAHWASGVSIVTTWREGGIQGMTVSSFCSVSLEPPLVLVSIHRGARAHRSIEQQGAFGVSLLRADQEEISNRCAGLLGETGNWLIDVPYRTAVTGAPVLADCLAWLDCRVWRAYDGGDHTLFLGTVEAATVIGGEPLLWHFRGYAAIDPSTRRPPPAPTDRS